MKVATRSSTKPVVVPKRFEVRLNHDVVNAYLRQQEQQRNHRQTRTKQTTTTTVGGNNNGQGHTVHTMNIASTESAQVNRTQVSNGSVVRKSYAMKTTQNAACQVNTIENSNRLVCSNGNNSSSSMMTSLSAKSSLQRNTDACLFKAMMSLSERHARAIINLKAEYNVKLGQLKRNYKRQMEEIKKEFFDDAES